MNYDILLQAFHWRSAFVPSGRSWYEIIQENAQRIKDSGFTLAWFPPPSDTVAPQGYEPRELNNLNSHYGSESQLVDAVNTLAPDVKAIADIVVNHRSGTANAEDFTNPQWSRRTIVSNDPIFGGSDNSINEDTGHRIGFSRDLDHRNPETQNGIIDWMNSLKTRVGFTGWRYDFVKGYAGWAVELYNRRTSPEFSVGEFFDYNLQALINWLDSTHPEPPFRSTAFDFPLRNILHQAVAWKNYHWLKYIDRPPGLMGIWPEKAVTFLENHDLEEVRNKTYGPYFQDGDQTVQGYAYLLTHPGIPCVFWPDIYDRGSDNEAKIRALIQIRKNYRIHSQSKIFIAAAEYNNVYAAYIQGDVGEVAVKIGTGSWQPSGSKWHPVNSLLTFGNDYAVWGDRGWI